MVLGTRWHELTRATAFVQLSRQTQAAIKDDLVPLISCAQGRSTGAPAQLALQSLPEATACSNYPWLADGRCEEALNAALRELLSLGEVSAGVHALSVHATAKAEKSKTYCRADCGEYHAGQAIQQPAKGDEELCCAQPGLDISGRPPSDGWPIQQLCRCRPVKPCACPAASQDHWQASCVLLLLVSSHVCSADAYAACVLDSMMRHAETSARALVAQPSENQLKVLQSMLSYLLQGCTLSVADYAPMHC